MNNVPKVVFIVPYRNRTQHKFFFSNYMRTIMSKSDIKDEYEIYFSHQSDNRCFNRGATKNIGFLAIKDKYPNDYKNITFVFNDIDTIPFSNILNYDTLSGVIKHFYGFEYALGGIVSIKGVDFELINGFPNFWGWGMEDKVLQNRCEKENLKIDRSQFYPIGSPNVLHLFDGVQRIINRNDPLRAINDNGLDGLMTIHNLEYKIEKESTNELDNVNVIDDSKIWMINIKTFMTAIKCENEKYYKYDLREPQSKIMNPSRINENVNDSKDDWSNIPFYPTKEKKNEMIKKYGKDEAEKIIKYSYENSIDPTKEVIPPEKNKIMLNKIRNYNELLHNINSSKRIIPPNINKYSKEYARIIAVNQKASISANIKLGGVYK